MFRRKVQDVNDIVWQVLRSQGLETPLMQKRIIDAWDTVMGHAVAQYTGDKFIRNQTLMVKIHNPALRADLNMLRTQLTSKLNDAVGAQVITDVKIY